MVVHSTALIEHGYTRAIGFISFDARLFHEARAA